MSSEQKLTDDEISSVKSLREQIITIISTVGQLKLTHELLQEDISLILSRTNEQTKLYKELLDKEKQLINGLLEKYGVGSLDIETGMFTSEK
jgi:hypothetical protein